MLWECEQSGRFQMGDAASNRTRWETPSKTNCGLSIGSRKPPELRGSWSAPIEAGIFAQTPCNSPDLSMKLLFLFFEMLYCG